ncbi:MULTISPECIES: GNAT family N-acetyltransferase [unclassified Lactobacillus]|uniref:GNAT family N-acetyltransferase n=1 Tax=unclassified Lactobacillus TaxID=2620435 RepID=UPI000EFB56E0|nr:MULTISPECIES: GNAT family N-acetyltransferase [unclassified Lactobacillus]RMC47217.1 N-acetyltransferase [Lactobacillus sp. ESL0230]RMC51882.1 N-acetyltransferase [Lactobacillus sp. ESL0225]
MANRVYLRSFELTDAPTILKWGQDQSYQDAAGFQSYQDLKQARVAVNQYINRQYSYGICLRQGKQLIGLAELYERGTNEADLLKTKEVGFLLDKEYTGHGYMTEALTMLFDLAFNQLRQEEIWAGTFTNNVKSQNLLKRLGFHYQYEIDLHKINPLFTYKEKYFLLKKAEWLKTELN